MSSFHAENDWTELRNRAFAFKAVGDFDKAIECMRRAILQATTPPDAIEDAGTLWNGLAELYQLSGKLQEAEEAARECVALRHLLAKQDDARLACALMFLAQVLVDRGNYDEANPLVREGLEIYQNVHGADHPVTNACRDLLSRIAKGQRRQS